MLTRYVRTCAFLAALLLLAAPLCHAAAGKGADANIANKDGIELILAHQKDLNLTADQVAKLTDLSTKINAQREKLKQDPEIRELYRDLNEARESGDQEALKSARKKMREAMEKKSGMKFDEVMADVAKILQPDQLKKVAELRKKNGMDANPAQTMKDQKKEETADANHQKPDVSKGAPALYEDN